MTYYLNPFITDKIAANIKLIKALVDYWTGICQVFVLSFFFSESVKVNRLNKM